jgi:hypothetical protein
VTQLLESPLPMTGSEMNRRYHKLWRKRYIQTYHGLISRNFDKVLANEIAHCAADSYIRMLMR